MSSARKKIISTSLVSAAVFLMLACETAQAPIAPPPMEGPSAIPENASDFSRDRVWGHLTALTEQGPRVFGSEGARQARDYITSELRRMGIEILETPESLPSDYELNEEDAEPDNIVAEIPGASTDIIVLVAPYDSREYETFDFIGANDGASGAALILEIADVLSQKELNYTTRLVFLDAEAPHRVAEQPGSFYRFRGSHLQAARFLEVGLVPRIRLLVAFNRICDADLAITRDLGSHRLYREDFWNAAAHLGHDDIFRTGQKFESAIGSHLSFLDVGVRRAVFISDSVFGGAEPPGLYAGTEDDDLEHCSPKSLQVVGEVSLEALRVIAHRLAKIDRFSTSPVAKLEPAAVPASDAEPVTDDESEESAPSAKTNSETDGEIFELQSEPSPADASVP